MKDGILETWYCNITDESRKRAARLGQSISNHPILEECHTRTNGIEPFLEYECEDDAGAFWAETPTVIKIASMMLIKHQRELLQSINDFISACESPIEKIMGAAMAIYFDDVGDYRVFLGSDFDPLRVPSEVDPHSYAIYPQVKLGKYRVDFLLCHCDPSRASSRNLVDWIGVVAVECDGYEFHDKDPEKNRADKARDRELRKLGIEVLRYSGSEIHQDAVKFAEDVHSFLRKTKPNLRGLCGKEPA